MVVGGAVTVTVVVLVEPGRVTVLVLPGSVVVSVDGDGAHAEITPVVPTAATPPITRPASFMNSLRLISFLNNC